MTPPSSVVDPASRSRAFIATPIGAKAVMAVTGAILLLYVVAHMLGNLQVFLGAEQLNAYAAGLRRFPALLWLARTVLLASVLLHIGFAAVLTWQKEQARPEAYAHGRRFASSASSRTMLWTGLATGLFVVYHVLHLTLGQTLPGFEEGDAYGNVINAFSVGPATVAYVAAVLLLGPHLAHGGWSFLQTLGVAHPRLMPLVKRGAVLVAIVIVLGFVAVPVAVVTGVIGR